MIEINDRVQCCGCNACGDICPKRCITYKTDIEGFWYPVVDKEKCIDCGLCEKVCPIIHSNALKHNDFEKPVCYAAENKTIKVIFDSTSGGLFSAFANAMYENRGFVGGAVFNEDMSVRQYISNDKNDLAKLRSSKYLQSNFDGFYKMVKELLLKEEKVLVCGSPCQMAALRSYLGKDYNNLIILDYICRGANSPKVWKKYLDTFEERYGSPVVYAKAKSKEYGWRNLTQKVTLANGKSYYETKETSLFMQGYLRTNVLCRPSCYECKFKGFPRISDITLGDFWGIEKLEKTFDRNLGTSLVMINSKKGEECFEKIKKWITFKNMPFESILAGNQALLKPLPKPTINRDSFFNELDSKTFTEVAQKYITTSYSRKLAFKKLLYFIYSVIRHTKLQPMALYKTIKYSGLNNLLHCKGLILSPYCCLNISKKSKMIFNGACFFGEKSHFPKSHLESRLYLADNSIFTIENDISIYYGADIELFPNAKLLLKGKSKTCSYYNIGTTIISQSSIIIGHDVILGRNVTIRDTNGNHYINTHDYINTEGVEIEDKVWIGEKVSVMPGAKIREGCVIGANSMVRTEIPSNCLAVGTPARVISNNILWK